MSIFLLIVRRDSDDDMHVIELPSALKRGILEPLIHFFYTGILAMPNTFGEGDKHELLRTVELLELKSDKLRRFLSESDPEQIMGMAIADGTLRGVEENMDLGPESEQEPDESRDEIVIKQEPIERSVAPTVTFLKLSFLT